MDLDSFNLRSIVDKFEFSYLVVLTYELLNDLVEEYNNNGSESVRFEHLFLLYLLYTSSLMYRIKNDEINL